MLTEQDIKEIRERLKDKSKGHRYFVMNEVGKVDIGGALADSLNPAGLSRPHQDGWPVPWSGGLGPALGAWAHIDSNRATQAGEERLCIVCGTALGADYVFANFYGSTYDHKPNDFERLLQDAPPSPTFVHPRCLLKAAAFCPFLKDQDTPGLTKTGEPLTRDELRQMLRTHDKENENES